MGAGGVLPTAKALYGEAKNYSDILRPSVFAGYIGTFVYFRQPSKYAPMGGGVKVGT